MDNRPSLTVCASLVGNCINQAALCRTCEVLGVERLVLPHPNNSWEFRKVAASAQRWQTIEYCLPEHLSAWLATQTAYTRIALAIASHTQLVGQYRFSAQTLLVLGRELTGIPNDITAQCDLALTIPQYGQVESLNVHTAGAIAIYEYNRQWR